MLDACYRDHDNGGPADSCAGLRRTRKSIRKLAVGIEVHRWPSVSRGGVRELSWPSITAPYDISVPHIAYRMNHVTRAALRFLSTAHRMQDHTRNLVRYRSTYCPARHAAWQSLMLMGKVGTRSQRGGSVCDGRRTRSARDGGPGEAGGRLPA